MRILVSLLLLVSFAVSADTTVVPGAWDLYRGTSKVSTHTSEAACVAAADALNVLRGYTCRTRTAVTVTADAPPPPPPPANPSPPASPNDNGTTLSWPAVTSDVNGNTISGVTYSVEQRVDGGPYALIVRDLAATTWAITGLAPGVYQWRVYVKHGDLASGPSPVWSKTIAAQPPPPPPQSATFPDFRAVYGVPWTPCTPEPPTITSRSTATSKAQLVAAMGIVGREVTVANGTVITDGVTISGRHIRVIFGSNVTFPGGGGIVMQNIDHAEVRFATAVDTTTRPRYAVTGGNGNFNTPVSHLLVNGIRTFDNGTAGGATEGIAGICSAVINSYLHTAAYGSYIDRGAAGTPRELIYWNNVLDSGNCTDPCTNGRQSALRWTNVERGVFVDNRVIHRGGLMLRLYTRADNFFSHNQVERGTNAGGSILDTSMAAATTLGSIGIQLRSNCFYPNGGDEPINQSAMRGSGSPVNVQGNKTFGSGFPTRGPAGFTFSGNTSAASASAPAWRFYQDRRAPLTC